VSIAGIRQLVADESTKADKLLLVDQSAEVLLLCMSTGYVLRAICQLQLNGRCNGLVLEMMGHARVAGAEPVLGLN